MTTYIKYNLIGDRTYLKNPTYDLLSTQFMSKICV